MASPTKKKRKPGRGVDNLHTIPGTKVTMQARSGTQPDVPAKRPYVFPEKLCEEIAIGVKQGMNLALTGPTGCGKTTLPIAVAAELNHPLIRFNCNGETRVSSMVGMDRPAVKDGILTLAFSPAGLVKAMKEGYWVVFDEIDAALPAVLFVLQPVLEEDNRRLYIPETGETVVAKEGFQIFATGNTFGYRSSARANHSGTNQMNDAFVDRFGMVLAVDYPDKDEERKRIKANCPHVQDIVIDGIARAAESLRTDQGFRADFSTRRCVQWARLVPEFSGESGIDGVMRAADCAVLRKLKSPTDAQVAREIINRIFGYGAGG